MSEEESPTPDNSPTLVLVPSKILVIFPASKHVLSAGKISAFPFFPASRTSFRIILRYDPLLKLKYLPDMVFAQNRIVISSPDRSSGIEFNAVDAVNSIRDQPLGDIQVASAETWQGSR
jgi:hypothetical protein